MNALETELIRQAGSQLGVTEATGHNDGKAVESYLKSVGLGGGYAWCMAFIYWCAKRAAASLGLINPLKCTGGVEDEWNSGRSIKITIPVTGCVCIMRFSTGWHAGIVTGVFKNGRIHLIEGNTSSAGGRDGNEVCRKWRNVNNKYIVGFLRLDDQPIKTAA